MAMHAGAVQRQHQIVSMSPEHIMGKLVLKMTLQELQQFVEEQLAENPALTMEEHSRCPVCGATVLGNTCESCNSEKLSRRKNSEAEWQETAYGAVDEYYEPFACVAAATSLTEHLKGQIALLARGEERRIAEFLIDSLDEDGYFREPMLDTADGFGISVPQLERILGLVQSLDPPGIGARDLRECMLLQLARLEEDSPERVLALSMLERHWDDFSRMKLDRITNSCKTDLAAVEEAVKFIRKHVDPHPAGIFRDPWERLAPRSLPRAKPDVTVRVTEDGLMAETSAQASGSLSIDSVYDDLYAEISQKKNCCSEDDRAHIKDSVLKARALLDAIEFRKSTLSRIADELLRYQKDFFLEGPFALKPLTKKELASRLGVHESTVCRATQDKTMQLPSGEVIPLDTLFDSALPVKEMVRQLSTQRLSDSEIAEKLSEAGVQIARRTVAKYREQLRILPIQYRIA
ncbi:MAG: RNA polymerase factor sigma-54 [Armatimonadota bacterium]